MLNFQLHGVVVEIHLHGKTASLNGVKPLQEQIHLHGKTASLNGVKPLQEQIHLHGKTVTLNGVKTLQEEIYQHDKNSIYMTRQPNITVKSLNSDESMFVVG